MLLKSHCFFPLTLRSWNGWLLIGWVGLKCRGTHGLVEFCWVLPSTCFWDRHTDSVAVVSSEMGLVGSCMLVTDPFQSCSSSLARWACCFAKILSLKKLPATLCVQSGIAGVPTLLAGCAWEKLCFLLGVVHRAVDSSQQPHWSHACGVGWWICTDMGRGWWLCKVGGNFTCMIMVINQEHDLFHDG